MKITEKNVWNLMIENDTEEYVPRKMLDDGRYNIARINKKTGEFICREYFKGVSLEEVIDELQRTIDSGRASIVNYGQLRSFEPPKKVESKKVPTPRDYFDILMKDNYVIINNYPHYEIFCKYLSELIDSYYVVTAVLRDGTYVATNLDVTPVFILETLTTKEEFIEFCKGAGYNES